MDFPVGKALYCWFPAFSTEVFMADVVTFGEAMIRLSPPNYQRIEQAATLDVQVGGGELNVAVGVRRLG